MNQEKPSMLEPALIGGAFLGVTSALPMLEYLNCACCMLIIGGGVLASYFYMRDYPSHLQPVNFGDGALVGLFSGALGSAVYGMVSIPLGFIKSQLGMDLDEFEQIKEALNDPNIPEGLREILLELFTGGGFSIAMIFFELVSFLVMAAVFATIGGILGVALFRKRTPPVTPPQARAPQPSPPSET
ncbi:hypothetical protein MYX65_04335 [Acidobacteria bacterium AH-259-L09]|nr:hypothetical protein [Acidobacteria bacterium AH-259-L09]